MLGKPRSLQSPPAFAEVSIREFTCGRLDTEAGHRRKGRIIPDRLMGRAAKVVAGSHIDPKAVGMVPLIKEDEMRAEHTELLRQIAANTAVLPEMKKDLAAIRKILSDYDAGRIGKDERDRRISRLIQ